MYKTIRFYTYVIINGIQQAMDWSKGNFTGPRSSWETPYNLNFHEQYTM